MYIFWAYLFRVIEAVSCYVSLTHSLDFIVRCTFSKPWPPKAHQSESVSQSVDMTVWWRVSVEYSPLCPPPPPPSPAHCLPVTFFVSLKSICRTIISLVAVVRRAVPILDRPAATRHGNHCPSPVHMHRHLILFSDVGCSKHKHK